MKEEKFLLILVLSSTLFFKIFLLHWNEIDNIWRRWSDRELVSGVKLSILCSLVASRDEPQSMFVSKGSKPRGQNYS